MSSPSVHVRPLISVADDGRIFVDGSEARVVMRRSYIAVNCTNVTPDALRRLLEMYESAYNTESAIVSQVGAEDNHCATSNFQGSRSSSCHR